MLVSGHFPLSVCCKNVPECSPTFRARKHFMYAGQESSAWAPESLGWKHQTALDLVLHSGGNSFNSKHVDTSGQTGRGSLSLEHPFSGFLQCSKCYINPFVSESYFSQYSVSSQGFCILSLCALPFRHLHPLSWLAWLQALAWSSLCSRGFPWTRRGDIRKRLKGGLPPCCPLPPFCRNVLTHGNW